MSDKILSILRSALISAAGALLAYLLAAVTTGGLDLGMWGPLAATALAWAVNTLRVNFPDILPPASRVVLWIFAGASIAATATGCNPCRCDRDHVQPVREEAPAELKTVVKWAKGETPRQQHAYWIPGFASVERGPKPGLYVVGITAVRPENARAHEIITAYPEDVRPMLDAAAAKLDWVIDHTTMPTAEQIDALPPKLPRNEE